MSASHTESVPRFPTHSTPSGERAAPAASTRQWLNRVIALRQGEVTGIQASQTILEHTESERPTSAVQLSNGHQGLPPTIVWRLEAIRRQLPHVGPVIPIVVRGGIAYLSDAPDCCAMCGDTREAGQRFICQACERAKAIAFRELWN